MWNVCLRHDAQTVCDLLQQQQKKKQIEKQFALFGKYRDWGDENAKKGISGNENKNVEEKRWIGWEQLFCKILVFIFYVDDKFQ